MERRDFIKKTALISAFSALGTKVKTESVSEPLQKNALVVILGAGISGLTAAYRLRQKGVRVLVLEARNRLGGRIFTYKFPETPEIYAELGGEWIGTSHKSIQNLCKELQLELISHRYSYDWLLSGKFTSAAQMQTNTEWIEKYKKILADFRSNSSKQKKYLEKISWWHFLQKNAIPEQELLIHELNDSTDFGESIRHVSAWSALSEYAYSNETDEMDFQVVGGNSKIIESLVEKIGREHILTGKKVEKVIQDKKKVQVSCSDGSVYQADKVICTLPTFALWQIGWSPELPLAKKNASEQLQYARIIKLQFLCKERFWQKDDFALNSDKFAHFIFHTTQKQNYQKGILTSYSVGDKAYLIGRMSKQEQIQLLIEAMKPAFGDVSGLIEQVVSYNWGSDPYTQGAYALYGIGQGDEIRDSLSEPFRNVLFAGEHIAEWQGFMEGAVQTAEDAVKKILG